MADIYKILLRRDTVANWENPNNQKVLGEGEPAVGLNETGKVIGLKIGDGIHTWNQLEYITGDFSTILDKLTNLDEKLNGNPEDPEDTGLVGQVNTLVETVGTLSGIVEDEDIGNASLNNRLTTAERKIQSNEGAIVSLTSNKEAVANKVSVLDNQSTATQYPNAKCVYDAILAEAQARDTADTNLTNDINDLERITNWLNNVPAVPDVAGTYTLKCSVEDGTLTYQWVEDIQL